MPTPVAALLPALSAAALLLGATLVLFAARLALLGRGRGTPSGFVAGWWRWLAGPREGPRTSRPPGAGVIALDDVRRARTARAAGCAPRTS